MASKSPKLLTPQQRELFDCIPDLSDQDIVRYYTFTPGEIALIKQQNGARNKLGFAMQLGALRFPGRQLNDLVDIPARVLVYIARQIEVPMEAFSDYGRRSSTVSEHLARIRKIFDYRDYGWAEMLQLARHLLPMAMESNKRLPLVEAALAFMRKERIIAPAISTVERLVWSVLRIAHRRLYKKLTQTLTEERENYLDHLLKVDETRSRQTPLAWLRAPPGKPSAKNMYQILERLAFLNDMQLPAPPSYLHPNRIRQLANQCSRYKAQALERLEPLRYRAYLVAHLNELKHDLVDQALDMFELWLMDLLRQGKNKQKRYMQKHAQTLNRDVITLADAAEAFLHAKTEALDPFAAVFSVVEEPTLQAAVQSARGVARPPDMDARDLIEKHYHKRRRALLEMYQTLEFRAVQDTDPALEALDYVVKLNDANGKRVRRVEQRVNGEQMCAPLAHLSRTAWRKFALLENGKIDPDYYEMAALYRLRTRLRAGDIYVVGSRRYQDFGRYLLTSEEWKTLKQAGQTRLAITGSAQAYLQDRQQQIETLLTQLQEALAEENDLSVDEEGKLHLARLDKITPDEVEAWERRIYGMVPQMQIADLIFEVDCWTNFLSHFSHLSTGGVPQDQRKKALVATILAMGMNISLSRMALATEFSPDQLAEMSTWYLRDATLMDAQAELDNFVLHHPLSKAWGDGTASSSDGIRIPAGAQVPNATPNPRYFGYGRGLTIVTHVADIWMPFGQPMITNNSTEALHVIDALCHHETDLDIQEHYTDTASATYHVFGLCALLGFRFAPRIKRVAQQLLYLAQPFTMDGPFAALLRGPIDTELIAAQWDDLLRLAASIRHGTVSAALIMRKLAAYPQQNQLAKALQEIGKLERTLFILTYLQDPILRRRIGIGLNKGEAVFSLTSALSFGQSGEIRDRDIRAQMNRASCLMLLVAAISAWNTVYQDKALTALEMLDMKVPEEYLKHIAPLDWKHINFFGQYHFDPAQAHALDNLRSLRRPRSDGRIRL